MEVQLNNNAIWKVRGDNTNEHGIIVFINSSIEIEIEIRFANSLA